MARTPLEPLPPQEMFPDPEPGVGLGDYELLEEIARGGMGIVFKARQKSLDRVVAVKMILAGEFASPEFAIRFRREAQVAARLRHPNIVGIYEVGEQEGRQFFSMEYIEGKNLNQVIAQKPFSNDASLFIPILIKITKAIHFAHENGVLHRDLKPSNILIDDQGEPHVTDFGLAKIVEDNQEGQSSSEMVIGSEITVTGQTLGSPNYLPPEQVNSRNGAVGPSSDIYALGALLYHLLTGRPPFVGDTIHETLAQVERQEPVPPRLLNPTVTRNLETICLKCLEKEPDRRYATALELAEDLERDSNGQPILARPISSVERLYRTARRHPTRSLLIIALMISLLSGLTGVTWLWQRAQITAQRESQERQRAEQLLNRLDFDRAETFLTAGQHDRALASLARAVRRDPKNRAITARLVSALTRESHLLPTGPFLEHESGVKDASFSPNGRWIATITDNARVDLWNATTFTKMGQPINHRGSLGQAVFHPTMSWIATGSSDTTARLWNVSDGTPVTPPLRHGDTITDLEFNPDGTWLATASRDGMVRFWNVNDGIQSAPSLNHPSVVLDLAINKITGDIATGCEDGNVYLWRRHQGEDAPQILPHPRKVTRVLFSPDHRRLLTVCHDGHLRLWDGSDGSMIFDVPVHSALASMTMVKFDPSGHKIVTCSWDKTAKILDANSGALLVGPLSHQGAPTDAAWLGDGEFLITGARDNFVRIWDARYGKLMGAAVRHSFLVSSVDVSSDGRRLLTASKDRTARLLDLLPGSDWSLQTSLPDAITDVVSLRDLKSFALATRGGAAIWDATSGRTIDLAFRSRQPLMLLVKDPGETVLAGVDMKGVASIWELKSLSLPRANFPLKPILEIQHGEPVNAMEFSANGELLLTAGGSVRIWKLSDGQEISQLQKASRIAVAHFRSDGERIITASWDKYARVWNSRTGQAITPPMPHERPVLDAVYDPSGRWIATASRDQTARIWNAETGAPKTHPLPHRHEVQRVLFGPHGRILASVSLDQHLSLWNVPDGSPAVSAPLRLPSRVAHVAFSPDGQWLATGTESGEVRVWSVNDGLPVMPAISHRDQISDILFTKEGTQLLSASWDGTAQLFDLTLFDHPAPPWLSDLAEAVGGLSLSEADVEEVLSARKFLDLRERLLEGHSTNGLHQWAQWFLADRALRNISYRSPISMADYVQRRLRENTTNSLRAALWISPTNQKVLSKWRSLMTHERQENH